MIRSFPHMINLILTLNVFILFCYFVCFGSFLNVLAHRFFHSNISFNCIKLGFCAITWTLCKQSYCPSCKNNIAWFDLVPIVSWIILRGSCRSCKQSISPIYPLVELITGLSFAAMMMLIEPQFWVGYILFFSALIVTIHTDFQTMFIMRHFTLGIIPIGLIFSTLHLLPITLYESILGIFVGYGILWSVNALYKLINNTDGIGQGDKELLATIGCFVGPLSCWLSLLIASFLGSCIGIIMLCQKKSTTTRIPFGPFLSLGALIATLFQPQLYYLFFLL